MTQIGQALLGRFEFLGIPDTGFTATDDLQLLLDRVTRTLSGVRSTATAEEALPVLSRAIEVSPKWAALLVEDGERMCAWYRALSDESRREIRTVALRHKQLSRDTRRRIKAAN